MRVATALRLWLGILRSGRLLSRPAGRAPLTSQAACRGSFLNFSRVPSLTPSNACHLSLFQIRCPVSRLGARGISGIPRQRLAGTFIVRIFPAAPWIHWRLSPCLLRPLRPLLAVHWQAYELTCAEFGLQYTREKFYADAGSPTTAVFKHLIAEAAAASPPLRGERRI